MVGFRVEGLGLDLDARFRSRVGRDRPLIASPRPIASGQKAPKPPSSAGKPRAPGGARRACTLSLMIHAVCAMHAARPAPPQPDGRPTTLQSPLPPGPRLPRCH